MIENDSLIRAATHLIEEQIINLVPTVVEIDKNNSDLYFQYNMFDYDCQKTL